MNEDLLVEKNHSRSGRMAAIVLTSILALTFAGCTGTLGTSANAANALELLTYSIYNKGALSPAELNNVTLLVMLNGKPMVVTNENGKIMLNGKVNITGTGIQACNGVIYVINDALEPHGDAAAESASPSEPLSDAGADTRTQPSAPAVCQDGQTIADILSADPR